MMHHQGQGDDGDVAALADDRGLAELDLVVFVGNRAFHRQSSRCSRKMHGVARAEGVFQEPLGIIGRRRHHDAQARKVAYIG